METESDYINAILAEYGYTDEPLEEVSLGELPELPEMEA